MSLIKKLQELGLNKNEAKIYILCLCSPLCPSEISRLVNIPRTSCYFYLSKLLEMNLLIKNINRKTILYSSTDINAAIAILLRVKKQELKEITKIGDQIIAEVSIKEENNIYKTTRGIQGYENLYKEILRDKKDIYWFGDFSIIIDTIGAMRFYKDFSMKRMHNSTTAYALTTNYIKNFKKYSEIIGDFRKMKIIDTIPAHSLFCIWGEKIAFVFKEDELKIVVIRQKFITKMILTIFLNYWEKA